VPMPADDAEESWSRSRFARATSRGVRGFAGGACRARCSRPPSSSQACRENSYWNYQRPASPLESVPELPNHRSGNSHTMQRGNDAGQSLIKRLTLRSPTPVTGYAMPQIWVKCLPIPELPSYAQGRRLVTHPCSNVPIMRALISPFGLAVAAVLVGTAIQDPTLVTSPPEHFSMRVVVSGLEGPWELTWGPDGQLWATERKGRRVIRINPADGTRSTLLMVHEVHQSVQQDGLLGLALHPDFLRGSDDVFLVFTYDDAPGPPLARRLGIRKYHYNQATRALGNPEDVITGLPTHDDHVGGRLAIGPDRKLYLTIGDQGSNFGSNRCNANHAQDLPTSAQVRAKDWSSYQGKILRVNLDGSIPSDNPEINGVRSHVFSYGHRNPLGLVFGPDGFLYESEHGPSTDDEVNLIESGRNYGWPNIAGYRDEKSYVYANWSASKGPACRDLPPGNAVPASVPTQNESAWNDPRFAPPLRTFFTV